ncbi:MAG TPA: hypothetical protein DDW86_06710 [Clostridiales bacterium]|nr:hypothetical protein [Clostridiales bacterium]
MRLFGSDRIKGIVSSLGMEEDQPIEHKLLSGQIEQAQKRVEGNNFDIRRNVLQYDDVMNTQREIIYKQRRSVLEGENLRDSIMDMVSTLIDSAVDTYAGDASHPGDWNWKGLLTYLGKICIPPGTFNTDDEQIYDLTRPTAKEELMKIAEKVYRRQEEVNGNERMREVERVITLRVVDQKWMDHIDAMDQLRQGIGLRAYGQRDPVQEYKLEGYEMFEEMIRNIQEEVVTLLFHVRVQSNVPKREKVAEPISATHGENRPKKPARTSNRKIGRNDPCPCGSGKKYKNCCGANL